MLQLTQRGGGGDMSVLDWLEQTNPRVASQIAQLDENLSQRLERRPPEKFLLRYLPSYAVEAVLADHAPPGGIFGVGAIATSSTQIYPAVFVIPALATRDSDAEWTEYSLILGPNLVGDTLAGPIVAAYARSEPIPKSLRVVGLPIPTEMTGHVEVGAELSCQTRQMVGIGMEKVTLNRGRCGVEVITSSGDKAVLTAGHVAQPVSSYMTTHDQAVGRVISTDYLAAHRPTSVIADVAVVKLDRGVTVFNNRRVSGPGSGKQLDFVVADGQQGSKQALVLGVLSSFALRTNVGCWGQVLITDRAISLPGDSGAPVYLDDDTGTVIGHVVAGAPPAYTVIQDIDYILQQGRVTLA